MSNHYNDENHYIGTFRIVLGIDIEDKVRQSFRTQDSWKQLEKAQQRKLEEGE